MLCWCAARIWIAVGTRSASPPLTTSRRDIWMTDKLVSSWTTTHIMQHVTGDCLWLSGAANLLSTRPHSSEAKAWAPLPLLQCVISLWKWGMLAGRHASCCHWPSSPTKHVSRTPQCVLHVQLAHMNSTLQAFLSWISKMETKHCCLVFSSWS